MTALTFDGITIGQVKIVFKRQSLLSGKRVDNTICMSQSLYIHICTPQQAGQSRVVHCVAVESGLVGEPDARRRISPISSLQAFYTTK
jgi:hypothetical protein